MCPLTVGLGGPRSLFEKEKISFPLPGIEESTPAALAAQRNEFLHPGSEKFPVAVCVSNSAVLLRGQALHNFRFCHAVQ